MTERRKNGIVLLVAFTCLAWSSVALAEIYKWVDEKGTVHFTEDPATIPEKYRDGTKSRTTEEDLMSPQEKERARKQEEEKVRERLKKEGKEYDAKEFEKRMKAERDKAERQKTEGICEIISYSQYEIVTDVHGGGGGHVIPGSGGIVSGGHVWADTSTCANLVIRNNTSEAKVIKGNNIIATTSREVTVRWSQGSGKPYPLETRKTFSPEGVYIQIRPGGTYQGSVCFGRELYPIEKMELRGL